MCIVMCEFKCKSCEHYEENVKIDNRMYRSYCFTYGIDVLELYKDNIFDSTYCKYFDFNRI